MCASPLEIYFEMAGLESPFMVQSTALWRGYVGMWEIDRHGSNSRGRRCSVLMRQV